MIKHVVLLKWKEGTSQADIDGVTAGFRALKEEIAEIVNCSFGEDAGIFRDNADYALVADFRNEADLKAYVSHPSHRQFLAEVTGPVLASFQSAQFQVPE